MKTCLGMNRRVVLILVATFAWAGVVLPLRAEERLVEGAMIVAPKALR